MRYTYAGIDSHKATHTAVFLNCFFEKAGEISFRNAPGEFPGFLKEAEKIKAEGTTLVFGMEDVSAYGRPLADFLSKRGYLVKHVNANLVAQERKNESLTRKTDSVDAQSAARVLLSKFDKLPNAGPQDKIWMLKSLVARRQFMMKSKTALKGQLYAMIFAHYPSYREFFTEIEGKSSLAFLKKYPSPKKLKGVTAEELTDTLYAESRFKVRGKAEQILERVEKDGDTSSDFQDMRDYAVVSAASQLEANLKEMEGIEALLAKVLELFDYPLTTMKGIDTVLASSIIAEIGDIKRFPTPAKLAQYAAVAPVTYASGQKDLKFANHRHNRRLNSLFYDLALLVSMTAGARKRVINPFFYDLYHRKLSEGKTKRQALKSVQRRLVNIIWNMMTKGEPYINPPSYNLVEK